jgi:selenocysteine lyase/cysteine desulfurase
MVDWHKIREDFPICKNMVYFQSAGMSPVSTPVFNSITQEYRKLNQVGDIYWDEDMTKCRQLYRYVEKLIHSEPGDVVFAANTSLVMSLLALSFRLNMQKHFNVVSMLDEFPSVSVPFEYQKIEMRYVEPKNARYSVASILEKTDSHTLAVVTSHVQYCTGFRQNLETLGRELKSRGILLLVNATQALPFFAVDVKAMNVDVLTASLHKWGGAGHVGSVFYTSPGFRKRFPPPMAGWLSIPPQGEEFIHTGKNVPFALYENAEQYNLGTSNLQPLLALKLSLQYMESIDWEQIRERLLSLTDLLIAGLQKLPVEIVSPVEHRDERSAIVVFRTSEPAQRLVERLAEDKICVACRKSNVRVSVNIFNNEEDIETLLQKLL